MRANWGTIGVCEAYASICNVGCVRELNRVRRREMACACGDLSHILTVEELTGYPCQ